jgi:hypothetical protein
VGHGTSITSTVSAAARGGLSERGLIVRDDPEDSTVDASSAAGDGGSSGSHLSRRLSWVCLGLLLAFVRGRKLQLRRQGKALLFPRPVLLVIGIEALLPLSLPSPRSRRSVAFPPLLGVVRSLR